MSSDAKELLKTVVVLSFVIGAFVFLFWSVGNKTLQVDNRIVTVSNWSGDVTDFHSGMTTDEIKNSDGVLTVYELTDADNVNFTHWGNPLLGNNEPPPQHIRPLTGRELMGVFETRGFEPGRQIVKTLDF